MQIGLWGKVDNTYLRLIRQLGVSGALFWGIRPPDGREVIDYLELVNLRALYNDAGLELFTLENLGNQAQYYDPIILGKAERDEKIEHIAGCLRVMGQAGVPHFGFHWMVAPNAVGTNPVFGTSHSTRIRGGATVRSFDLEKANKDILFRDREYTEEEIWANFEYFIKAIIPVAEEAGVTLSLHPDDPPVPKFGGIPRLFGTFEGFQRAVEIAASPHFGLTFCLGNWGLMGPGVAEKGIRYFGERGKICYVHLQAVQGTREKFNECFFEEGQLDFLNILRLLREVNFDGYVLPSHAARVEGDLNEEEGLLSSTYCVGYLQSLLRILRDDGGA